MALAPACSYHRWGYVGMYGDMCIDVGLFCEIQTALLRITCGSVDLLYVCMYRALLHNIMSVSFAEFLGLFCGLP